VELMALAESVHVEEIESSAAQRSGVGVTD
jgi:hypothetical protein